MILHFSKRTGKYLIIIGLILIIAGIVFTMQSKSIVGPLLLSCIKIQNGQSMVTL